MSIYCFSLFYITLNWIYLDYRTTMWESLQLATHGQNKQISKRWNEWMETAFKLLTPTGHRQALSSFLCSCRLKQADGLCCCSLPLIWTLTVILLMRTTHTQQLHRAANTLYSNYRTGCTQTIQPLKCNTTVILLMRPQDNRLKPEHAAASNASLHLHCNPANGRGWVKQSIYILIVLSIHRHLNLKSSFLTFLQTNTETMSWWNSQLTDWKKTTFW